MIGQVSPGNTEADFFGLVEEIRLDQPGFLSANCILQTAHWTVHKAHLE